MLGSTIDVNVVGHSFGSCPIAWLIHLALTTRIQKIVLVNPVSILLSEPDVMTNCLYRGKALKKSKRPIKIGVVSNEIFTERYLRLYFAWYNTELLLEDLPSSAKVLVCLSAQESIVPARKVQREIILRSKPDDVESDMGRCGACPLRYPAWNFEITANGYETSKNKRSSRRQRQPRMSKTETVQTSKEKYGKDTPPPRSGVS